MTKKEIWKDIPDFEGYQVSSLGRVRSFFKRIHSGWAIDNRPNRILRPGIVNGYYLVSLRKNGANFVIRIHCLVLLAFVGPRPEGLEICHADGDKSNNCLDNLRYDTHENNVFDTIQYNDGVFTNALLTKDDVIKIRLLAKENVPIVKIVDQMNISYDTANSAINGSTYSYITDVAPIGRKEQREIWYAQAKAVYDSDLRTSRLGHCAMHQVRALKDEFKLTFAQIGQMIGFSRQRAQQLYNQFRK